MLDKHRNNEHVGDVAAADAEFMFFALQKICKGKTISILLNSTKKRKKKPQKRY